MWAEIEAGGGSIYVRHRKTNTDALWLARVCELDVELSLVTTSFQLFYVSLHCFILVTCVSKTDKDNPNIDTEVTFVHLLKVQGCTVLAEWADAASVPRAFNNWTASRRVRQTERLIDQLKRVIAEALLLNLSLNVDFGIRCKTGAALNQLDCFRRSVLLKGIQLTRKERVLRVCKLLCWWENDLQASTGPARGVGQ
ncbi:hypothetical protein J6590_032399 [Homalodisca vitripennis]|nr:hypothetical protein J6590_032399 [Homalodisca vitripennis]